MRAWYNYAADGASAGTTWCVWQTDDGSEPDPTGDPDYTETMLKADGVAKLDYTAGSHVNGTTVKTLVRTRRTVGGENIDSTNTTSYSATASTTTPSSPSADAFLGSEARQGQ